MIKARFSDSVVLQVISRVLTPFILVYGFYIQLHGEYSPGGGFQAGVIVASAFFLFALICGLDIAKQVLPLNTVKIIACLGAILYASVGIVAIIKGGNFLEYNALAEDPHFGQFVGIVTIEFGVGLTVFGVMMAIYYVFAGRGKIVITETEKIK